MEQAKMNCPYCGRDAFFSIGVAHYEYNCPVCGKYAIIKSNDTFGKEEKNKIASYLFYKRNSKNRFLGTNNDYALVKDFCPDFNLITMDEIEAFWPKTFSERITNMLLWLDSESSYPGERIYISHGEFQSLMFFYTDGSESEIDNQYRFFTNYFNTQKKYAKLFIQDDGVVIDLTPLGYERIEEFQLDKRNNKKVFVSMAFNKDTYIIREAIKQGIIGAGYDATLIDEIIHNKQIVPEMFRLIRESRLLVMDISEPNYGAYYEAGYAQGLGKEVIITCSEERFYKKYESEEETKYEKYLKPHFDIAQKQLLLWKDTDDLTIKLKEWIKAIE